jgi:large subunit ribosomal protein L19
MSLKIDNFNKIQMKTIPNIRPGDIVKVVQKIKDKEKGKEKAQFFEGLVIAIKHGKGVSATITVRKIISGIGVEKVFPMHSPLIEKIEILKSSKVRRAKLYYLREATGIKSRLKRKDLVQAAVAPKNAEVTENKI